MASQTGATKAKGVTPPVVIPCEGQQVFARMNSAISDRAYELFERDGHQQGEDLNHWLQAESEIVNRIPEIQESSSWYAVNVPAEGINADELSVGVESKRAVIARQKGLATSAQGSVGGSLFLVADWRSEVEPETASAYINNNKLILTVKKRLP